MSNLNKPPDDNEEYGYFEECQSMKRLVDHTVKEIEVSLGEEYLRITTYGGEVCHWQTEGDCCSETWFAEIIGVDALLGHTVISVEDAKTPWIKEDDGHTRQDSDQIYGIAIKTSAGTAVIVFRNSSNGYYGGNIRWCPPGDPTLLNWKAGWRNIKDDWTAY